MRLRLFLISTMWLLTGSTLTAQTSGPAEATPQRPTFTSDTSTAAPGTLELEFGLSSSGELITLPALVKFTPDLPGWGRQTEISLGFEGLSSLSRQGRRENQFGDRLTLALRKRVYAGDHLSLALVPQSSFFLRDEQGARLDLTGILVVSRGASSLALNATWTSATRPSPANPAQKYDVAADFSRALGTSPVTLFAGVLYENPSAGEASLSLGQGLTWRVRPNWVLDLGFFELGLADGPRDFQLQAGFTVNLGRPARW